MGKGFRPFTVYQFSAERREIPGGDVPNGHFIFPEHPFLKYRRIALLANTLPQLFNVLKGEMSLVGPKPESPSTVAKYPGAFESILTVAPGIVDLASFDFDAGRSVSANRERPELGDTQALLPKKIKLAKAYVQCRSFSLDLKILFTALIALLLASPSPFSTGGGEGKKPIKDLIFHFRGLIIFSMHVVAVVACNYAAFLLRFDGTLPPAAAVLFFNTISFVVLIRLACLYLFGLNHGLWRYTGVRDMLNLGWAVLSSSVLIWGLIQFLPGSGYPRSIHVIDSILLLVVLSFMRSSKRIYSILTQTGVGSRRVLIIGAGNAGEMIVRDMKQDRRGDSQPVAFIDDDPKKRGKKIHNIPVIGTTHEIEAAFAEVHPTEILIAIPSATPMDIKNIINRCKPLKCPIKTLPSLASAYGRKISVNDIRALDIEDLIGRAEIRIHDPLVEKKIRGKRVLVTGAGGSIGSELCRQLAAYRPEALILFEQSENNLYRIELDLLERAPDLSLRVILGDIVDTEKVNKVFLQFQPQIVFHAAAYKHVPMMEKNPFEAVRNNIIGTYRLMAASDRHDVEEFVLISTDKAVSPSSVMGASKRVAEMMVRYFDGKSRTKLVSVRFGNVLESSGSIVPLFRERIKNRKPIKVTHPEVKRYFISLQEAVQLVLEASVLGEGGEVFVLDMGQAIKILDLAKTMITLSGFTPGDDIPIQIIGLRPGEKLHEGLFEDNEEVIQTHHEKIRLARNGKIEIDLLSYIERFEAMDTRTCPKEIKSLLKELIPSYLPGGPPIVEISHPETAAFEV